MEEVLLLRRPLFSLSIGALILLTLPWFSGGQEPVARLIGTGALVAVAIMVWRQPQVRRLSWRGLPTWAVALLVWATLSLLWSVNRFQSVQWVALWIMVLATFVTAYRTTDHKDARKWFSFGYLLSVSGVVVYGLYLYLTVSYDRFTSSFYWANPAAAYLIPALVLLIHAYSTEHKNWYKTWLLPLLAGIIGAAFLLAASRGATVILAISLIAISVNNLKNRQYWIKIVFTLLVALIAAKGLTYVRLHVTKPSGVTTSTSLAGRFSAAAKGETTSLTDRLNYLSSTWSIWLDNPVLGTGAGTFATVHPQYQRRVISASANAHNAYLQVFAELGVVGGGLLLLVIATLVISCVKSVWYDPELMPWCIGGVALLAHMAIDIDGDYPSLVLLAAVFMAFSYRVWQVQRSKPGWIVPVALIGILWPVISVYQSGAWADGAAVTQTNGDIATAQLWYARAHQGLVYDPDTINAEGIDFYTLAIIGQDRSVNTALAIDRAQLAHKQDPRDAQHLFLLGRVYHLTGDSAKAIEAYNEMLKLDPYNHPEYYQALARVQMEVGDTAGALKTCLTGTSMYTDAVVANRNLDTNFAKSVAGLLVTQSQAEAKSALNTESARDNARAVRLFKAAQAADAATGQ